MLRIHPANGGAEELAGEDTEKTDEATNRPLPDPLQLSLYL